MNRYGLSDKELRELRREIVTSSAADDLPDVEFLRRFFEATTASTYPSKTLQRRLSLLTKAEHDKCDRFWRAIVVIAEQIDNTIAERAEQEQDPWP